MWGESYPSPYPGWARSAGGDANTSMWGESYPSPYQMRAEGSTGDEITSMWGESYPSPYSAARVATRPFTRLQCGGRVTPPRIPNRSSRDTGTPQLQCGGRVTPPRIGRVRVRGRPGIRTSMWGESYPSPYSPTRPWSGLGSSYFNVGGELPLPVWRAVKHSPVVMAELQCGGRVTPPRMTTRPPPASWPSSLQCGGRVTPPRIKAAAKEKLEARLLQCGGRVTPPRIPAWNVEHKP